MLDTRAGDTGHGSRWLHLALLAAVVVAAHGPALRASEFHFDDGHSLVRNPHLRDPACIPRFFVDPTLFGENPVDAMYRPLVLTLHALNLRLAGDDPAGFVAVNLALHVLVTLLVAGVLSGLSLRPVTALAGAALFGLHPLQTEVVNYVSARSESIAALGIFLGILAYTRYRHQGRARWLALVAAGQLVAVGGKEVGAVLPLLLAALEVLRPGRTATRWRATGVSALALLPYLLFYQAIRTSSPGFARPDVITHLATQSKALVHYVATAMMPVHLSVYPQFRAAQALADPAVAAAALAGISAGALLWRGRHRHPLLATAGAWWILCLLPTLVVPLNVLVNDHRPYTALMAAPLLLAGIGVRLAPTTIRTLALAAGILMTALCWQRAAAWRSEIDLWTAAVRTGPAVAPAHYNLAFAWHRRGDLAAARAHYERAIALEPDYVRPLTNLGALYREAGDLDRAAALLARAVRADSTAVAPRNNLGLVYAARGDLERAVATYRQALRVDPQAAEVWLNLGLALRDAGRRQEAYDCLRRALQLDPDVRRRLAPAGAAGQRR